MTAEQSALAFWMSEWSEDNYCARWLIDLEFMLWSYVTGDGDRLSAGDKAVLRQLSDACGGWVVWTDEGGETFVPMADWLPMYERQTYLWRKGASGMTSDEKARELAERATTCNVTAPCDCKKHLLREICIPQVAAALTAALASERAEGAREMREAAVAAVYEIGNRAWELAGNHEERGNDEDAEKEEIVAMHMEAARQAIEQLSTPATPPATPVTFDGLVSAVGPLPTGQLATAATPVTGEPSREDWHLPGHGVEWPVEAAPVTGERARRCRSEKCIDPNCRVPEHVAPVEAAPPRGEERPTHVWTNVTAPGGWVCTMFGTGRYCCPNRAVVWCEADHCGAGTCLEGRCSLHRRQPTSPAPPRGEEPDYVKRASWTCDLCNAGYPLHAYPACVGDHEPTSPAPAEGTCRDCDHVRAVHYEGAGLCCYTDPHERCSCEGYRPTAPAEGTGGGER